jgi:hypothetical protein
MSLISEALPLIPLACLALLFTPIRRCALIGPLLLAGVIGGYTANMVLWKATGGALGRIPDLWVPRHAPGAAPAAFMPLWTLALVVIVGTVIGLSLIIIRQSIRDNAQHVARLRMNARPAGFPPGR